MENAYLTASDGLLARGSGEWAKRKHHYLRNYCGITTVSMRNRFQAGLFGREWPDLGAAKLKKLVKSFQVRRLWHSNMTLQSTSFIEDDPASVEALRHRVSNHPKTSRIKIFRENWINVLESGRLRFDDFHLSRRLC